LTGLKLDLLIKLNELTEYARRGDEFLPDEICNFLLNEFDLSAVALFKVGVNNSLENFGKSAGVNIKSSVKEGFNCSVCDLSNHSNELVFKTDKECIVRISGPMIQEACSYFNLPDKNKILFKFAKKSSFTQSDKDSLKTVLQLFSFIVSLWFESKTGISRTPTSFPYIASTASTELKSLANAIIGYTNVLSNEKLTPSQLEYLAIIKKNTQSIILNVNDLNEFSKIESDRIVNNLKKVLLSELINEIINLFKNRLSARKIIFSLYVDKELNRPVNLDDQKVRYIITSLLFISTILTSQGEITIKAGLSSNKKIKISIADSGKSLGEDSIKNIFEPFGLSKIEEFKNSTLTGLSLALAQKYAKYLGGEISASTIEGKGNSFTFTINGEMMSELESTITKLPSPSSINKVLVIEDDYATSRLLSNYLNKWGYNPVIVNTEEQAFNFINTESLLAIILDIELPNVNGLELLKKLREHPKSKKIPVIVCSVEPEQQKAFMMGAIEYFIKPINYNFLVEVLTNYKLRKNSNILCVDDDVPTLNLIKQAIESCGFIAVAESVSSNVMNLIKDKDIDLAIIDLDMPDPNGFELIKTIKANKKYAHVPIIIYTGKENYAEDLKNIEGLFEDLLDKRSSNIEDLADTINAMINRYETPPPVEEVINKENVIKVLLAEDYKHSQIIVTRLLKKNGFENVVVVENGEDAVKMATQEKFNIILMDMQMPIMNGFEATEKIREMPEYKDTPIVALTAFAMKGDREKCLEAGATDYIPKPIDSKEFIEKVKYYTNTLA
jgi:CheY-like chemotaxis protein